MTQVPFRINQTSGTSCTNKNQLGIWVFQKKNLITEMFLQKLKSYNYSKVVKGGGL